MFSVLVNTLVPGIGSLTLNPLVKLLDRMPVEDPDSPGGQNSVNTAQLVEEL